MPPSVELISEIQALKEETNNFIYGKQSQLKLNKKQIINKKI